MQRGRLVIIVGIDGSGKSTLLKKLENYGYNVSHWRELRKLKLYNSLNFVNPAEVVQKLDGIERLEFIWEYIDSEWKYLIEPILVNGKTVISDGFFVRFLAKEQVYNKFDPELLLKRFSMDEKVFIIMVDIPPEIALKRKKDFKISPYESLEGEDGFIRFQAAQRKNIINYVKNFKHEIIDGTLDENEVLDKVLNILQLNNINP